MTNAGKTKEIEIEVGLRQGSELNSLRCSWSLLCMFTEEIEEGTPWIGGLILFVDDLVLCDPDREIMEAKLQRWREYIRKIMGLKSAGRKPNTYSYPTGETDPVTWIQKRTTCQQCIPSNIYMINDIDRRGRARKHVESRVANARSTWRYLTGVICDKKDPTKMKLLIIPDVDSTDVDLRLRNMANVSLTRFNKI